ncbi:hypothetical protein GQ54DRAFT_321056 [Martensiomyces pterosporus]|nr:hypothetical protein GQ54DRAFT_321056 [Martensiomyces pterosporus]
MFQNTAVCQNSPVCAFTYPLHQFRCLCFPFLLLAKRMHSEQSAAACVDIARLSSTCASMGRYLSQAQYQAPDRIVGYIARVVKDTLHPAQVSGNCQAAIRNLACSVVFPECEDADKVASPHLPHYSELLVRKTYGRARIPLQTLDSAPPPSASSGSKDSRPAVEQTSDAVPIHPASLAADSHGSLDTFVLDLQPSESDSEDNGGTGAAGRPQAKQAADKVAAPADRASQEPTGHVSKPTSPPGVRSRKADGVPEDELALLVAKRPRRRPPKRPAPQDCSQQEFASFDELCVFLPAARRSRAAAKSNMVLL